MSESGRALRLKFINLFTTDSNKKDMWHSRADSIMITKNHNHDCFTNFDINSNNELLSREKLEFEVIN